MVSSFFLRFFIISSQVSQIIHHVKSEYRNKTIARIFGGNPRLGCYFLALMIFLFGILRDSLYVLIPAARSVTHPIFFLDITVH